jgi:ipoprotein LpqH
MKNVIRTAIVATMLGAATLGLAGAATAAPVTAPISAAQQAITETTTTAGTATATAGASQAKVLIEGQDQNIQGPVACTTTGDTVNIAIGDATRGIGAVLSTTEPPEVRSVGLGTQNGVTFGYSQDQGVPQGVNWSDAEATKDGNTYKITGTAMGIDPAYPLEPMFQGFEINVTCP